MEDEDSESWSSEEDVDMPNLNEKDKMEEEDEIEFEFYDSNPNQFHSVKNLINSLLDGQGFNSSELADLITKQVELGTMIGVEEGDSSQLKEKEILGLASIVNLHNKDESLQQIQQYLNSKLEKQNGIYKALESLAPGEKVGLLINERVLNLSPQLVPVLFEQLSQDLNWANSQQEYKGIHEYKYILTMSQCFKSEDKQSKQPQKRIKGDMLQQYIYAKFEDYLFLTNSVAYQLFEGKMAHNQSGLTAHDNENSQKVTKMIVLMTMAQFLQNIKKIPLQLE